MRIAQTTFCVASVLGSTISACAETSSPLSKLSEFVVYSDPVFYSSFPSIVARPDGELLCAFRRAPSRKHLYGASSDSHTDPNSQLVLVRSQDNAETWTTSPELIFAHPIGGSQDPCMIQLRDGSIVCTSYGWSLLPPEQDAMKPAHKFTFLGGYVLRSPNGGKSWDGPFIPPDITGKGTRPTYNRGALAQNTDGDLLWAVVNAPGPPRQPSVHLLQSSDAGENWRKRGEIASDENVEFNETSLIITRAGDIVAFLRTDGLGGNAAIARSTDGGQSFSKWQDLGFHAVPLQALRLRNDRILLVYGYRKQPFGVRARLLNADASDASTAPEFVLRDDGGNGDLGYPWAVQLANGRILVVYYINLGNGPRHIAGTFLETK